MCNTILTYMCSIYHDIAIGCSENAWVHREIGNGTSYFRQKSKWTETRPKLASRLFHPIFTPRFSRRTTAFPTIQRCMRTDGVTSPNKLILQWMHWTCWRSSCSEKGLYLEMYWERIVMLKNFIPSERISQLIFIHRKSVVYVSNKSFQIFDDILWYCQTRGYERRARFN